MKIKQTRTGQIVMSTQPSGRRSYAAANVDRLVSDWFSNSQDADGASGHGIQRMRDRARQMARDSDHVQSLLRLITANVLGPKGIRLSMRLKRRNGKLRSTENTAIQEAWERWGMFETASYDRRNTWRAVESLVLKSCVRDGAAFVWRMIDPENPFGFSVLPVEYDLLDHTLHRDMPGGNRVRYGIEQDGRGRIAAYWFWSQHPGDPHRSEMRHLRVPADDVIHVYRQDRIGQTLGVSWLAQGMRALQMLDGYREAELVAARIASSKMGFFKAVDPNGMGAPAEGSEDQLVQDVAPAQWEVLPRGWEFQAYDPQHPNTAYADFEKANLRSFAAGVGVNYNELARDYEGVNYSSLRAAALSDRDYYRELQAWYAEALHSKVFESWYAQAELRGLVSFAGAMDYEAVSCACHWRPRGWQWVDPQKEVAAAKEALALRLNSRQDIVGQTGRTIEEVDAEIGDDPNYEDVVKQSRPPQAVTGKPEDEKNPEDNTEEEAQDEEEEI